MQTKKRIIALLLAAAWFGATASDAASAAETALSTAAATLAEARKPANLDDALDRYDVVWEAQSSHSGESMPVGGHDVGLNVWVQDGSLYFYIGKSDALDENNMLAKLGRVKITLEPNPFGAGRKFRQELLLRDGYLRVAGEDDQGKPVTADIWVDVFQPVVHVEINGESEFQVTAEYQGWRNEDRAVDGAKTPIGLHEILDFRGYQGVVTYHKDTVSYWNDSVCFYHKNDNDDLVMNKTIERLELSNKLDKPQWYDPTTDFTFGGVMSGDGMKASDAVTSGVYNQKAYRAWSLVSERPATSRRIKIGLHTGRYENVDQWKADLIDVVNASNSHRPSVEWWNCFWERSYLFIDAEKDESDVGRQIARNYALFRYMLGCNEFGALPTKFNGGLFTWDYNGDPDYRKWGGGSMTAQNQRHLYWPMLKSGDFNAMLPEFDFYNNGYRNAEQAVKAYWGHDGALFEEYPAHYGLGSPTMYGWENREGVETGVAEGIYVRHEYVHQLDFAAMILEYRRYSGEDISKYVGFLESATLFFLEHYRMRYREYLNDPDDDGYDENGKLVIYPSTAVETYKNVLNPNDVIAALTVVLNGLLELEAEGCDVDGEKWRDMLSRLPDMTISDTEFGKVYAPGLNPGEMGLAGSYKRADYWVQNIEAPQLSLVYPFNLVSQGRDGADVARNTWKTLNKSQLQATSWHYTNIVAARLGMTEEAKNYAIKKLSDGPFRFPAFWGPGYDWTPDHNWGGTGMMGLQEMALQCYDDVVQPCAAWPETWNNRFRLRAPMKTTVEGKFDEGALKYVKIALDADSRRERVTFRYPGAQKADVVDRDGGTVDVEIIDADTLAFSTKAGDEFYILNIPRTLSEPKGLRARRERSGAVTLAWNPVVGAERYIVYRRDAQTDASAKVLGEVAACSYTDDAAEKSGGPYRYSVAASADAEAGPLSVETPVVVWQDIAEYEFEAASDLGKDSLGNADGQVSGTVLQDVGLNGNAASLAGTGYVSVPHRASLALDQSFRMEVSIYPTQYGNYTRIVDKYGEPGKVGRGFLLDLAPDGRVRLLADSAIEGDWRAALSHSVAPLNRWTTLAVEFDYENMEARLYINGALERTGALTKRLEERNYPLRIGADQSGGSRFVGRVDSLRVEGGVRE